MEIHRVQAVTLAASNAPYSFSGTLIAVIWAVEFVAQPGSEYGRIEITIAPDAQEISLPRIPQPKRKGMAVRRN